ncbi:Hsp20/alpha crystallin family protein [Spirosoma montaniterrae]|uniref:SHSP domain-containing protein n=1 Tax=Spirosoma montaniterrae TaxID=1178516 RepID=A0A1P9X2U2_9BACT|nr:Hsp20/alpha crystallin family protein [Spirosoma montaniterrae]AQG81923.1 hypothetical protein AWR27_23075 [Spirosoma montaniterrae]
MRGQCNPGYGSARQQYGSPFYGKFGGPAWTGPAMVRRPKYNVPINILDRGDAFDVYVYALGFDKENITVSVADDLLHISGTRSLDADQEPNFVRQEYPVKTFERVVQLNDKVDVAGISARQENGVLIVTLPKKPETPTQQVAIA